MGMNPPKVYGRQIWTTPVKNLKRKKIKIVSVCACRMRRFALKRLAAGLLRELTLLFSSPNWINGEGTEWKGGEWRGSEKEERGKEDAIPLLSSSLATPMLRGLEQCYPIRNSINSIHHSDLF